MEKINSTAKATIDFKIRFELTQSEASALEAIAGYGIEPFLKTFYEHLGKAYLQPYEKACTELFKRIKDDLPREIKKIDVAREAINTALKPFI